MEICNDCGGFIGTINGEAIGGKICLCGNMIKQRPQKKLVFGEWQLCPKCLGEGIIPNNGITSSCFKTCDMCNGEKKLIKPIILDK